MGGKNQKTRYRGKLILKLKQQISFLIVWHTFLLATDYANTLYIKHTQEIYNLKIEHNIKSNFCKNISVGRGGGEPKREAYNGTVNQRDTTQCIK